MPPTDSAAGAGGKHTAVYVSLHRGEERPPLGEQVMRLLPRLAAQGYQVDQARLYGDVDGPLIGPRRRQLRRFLATVRRLHLSGSVAFTTTANDDRAFLAVIAGTFGFTYAEAAGHITLSADWTTSRQPGRAR